MLKAKESGRVFYPSKVRHSRHNSHSDQINKFDRTDSSPLYRSHDSSNGSSTDNTSQRSSSNDSGRKSESSKSQDSIVADIGPIQLSLEDESTLVVTSLLFEVVSNDSRIKYEFDKADLVKLFESVGPVNSITIHEQADKATVVMQHQADFNKVQQHLHNYKLPHSNAYLTCNKQFEASNDAQASCSSACDAASTKQRETSEIQTTINKIYQAAEPHAKQSDNEVRQQAEQPQPAPAVHKTSDCDIKVGVNKDCSSVSKFTCKYEIPIKSLPGFSVARKIIGHRGKHMKHILEQLKGSCFGGPIQDVIKLRLRGQGSGFKEGPDNCESPEPLHLCISSKYHQKYVEACKLVEKLLKDVFCEYNNYCRYRGRPTHAYKITKMENNPASYLSNY